MNKTPVVLPQLFKGIALFTPGGDVVYCIDPCKHDRWHLHLCLELQKCLGLSEPPHFLIPGYTATIDRWFDPKSHQPRTIAETYPAVKRYRPLLSVLFGVGELVWQTASWQEEVCNPIILETYRHRFPELWETHDLIVRFDSKARSLEAAESVPVREKTQGYALRLFVSGNNAATQRTLETIHQLLEQGLRHPYTLKVIDISKYPEKAETNQVSATPTLVRIWPQPVRRIVGELEDLQKVLQILATY